MTGFNTLPGAIIPVMGVSVIAFDGANDTTIAGASSRTNGLTMAVPIQGGPSFAAGWSILAFSLQVKIGLNTVNTPAGQGWGRLGALWAGLLTGSNVAAPDDDLAWKPASFPVDLSTFIKIWDGSTDGISSVVTNGPEADWTLIAGTFQLPFPLKVSPGTPLGFCLILTPSIVDNRRFIWVKSCQYSIIYQQEGR